MSNEVPGNELENKKLVLCSSAHGCCGALCSLWASQTLKRFCFVSVLSCFGSFRAGLIVQCPQMLWCAVQFVRFGCVGLGAERPICYFGPLDRAMQGSVSF